MAKQEQGRALDKPISTPEPAAGSPLAGTSEPAEQRRQGAMGERRVSESPPEARLLPVGVSEGAGGIAGAAGSRPGLRSSRAVAGAPIATGAPSRMHPGGAGRPPRSPVQAEDFLTTYRRMRCLYNLYSDLTGPNFKQDYRRAEESLKHFVKYRFDKFCGEFKNLPRYYGRVTKAEQAYMSLQEKARQADNDGNRERASGIRDALAKIDRHAAANLKELCGTHGLAAPSSTQEPPQMPATAGTTFDWCMTYRQLCGIRQYFERAGRPDDAMQWRKSAARLEMHVRYRFTRHCKQGAPLPPLHSGDRSRAEQRYHALEDLIRRTETASGGKKAASLREAMQEMNRFAKDELSLLARRFGPLADLAARAGLPPSRGLPDATPMAAAAPSSGSSSPEAGAAEVPTVTELFSQPPGPSSRVMPTQAPRTPTAPAPEVPLAQRQAIVERFRSDEALLYAGFALGNSGAYALGWTATRSYRVLDDLYRLHNSAREDPRAAAALADIDWSGIEAMAGTLNLPSLSP